MLGLYSEPRILLEDIHTSENKTKTVLKLDIYIYIYKCKVHNVFTITI